MEPMKQISMKKGIVVIPKESQQEELRELCDDITEYTEFVRTQTGLSGEELFNATRGRYSKIGWAPWDKLTWKPAE